MESRLILFVLIICRIFSASMEQQKEPVSETGQRPVARIPWLLFKKPNVWPEDNKFFQEMMTSGKKGRRGFEYYVQDGQADGKNSTSGLANCVLGPLKGAVSPVGRLKGTLRDPVLDLSPTPTESVPDEHRNRRFKLASGGLCSRFLGASADLNLYSLYSASYVSF